MDTDNSNEEERDDADTGADATPESGTPDKTPEPEATPVDDGGRYAALDERLGIVEQELSSFRAMLDTLGFNDTPAQPPATPQEDTDKTIEQLFD
ncbi:hypothetical protein [uncultured Bifidobacterium sp.]|uniref:hypothetical protein n=1 Tax=uncultured Bifidobacterium sp. TaxID=165187 RepID=UPI002629E2C5|nr:hypothetical protein [uncultured Bifidobacterium sp.]